MTAQSILPGFEPVPVLFHDDGTVEAPTATQDRPRVFDEAGNPRCPSCNSPLRRGWYCTPCNRVGATAPTLTEGS